MDKRIGIVGKNRQSGIQFFNWITEIIPQENIRSCSKNIFKYEVITNDHDYYRLISASELSRGNRFHQMFIEMGVDPHFINSVAKPCLVLSPNKVLEKDMLIYYLRLNESYLFFVSAGGIEFYTRNNLC